MRRDDKDRTETAHMRFDKLLLEITLRGNLNVK
jgi:hypothetical protein